MSDNEDLNPNNKQVTPSSLFVSPNNVYDTNEMEVLNVLRDITVVNGVRPGTLLRNTIPNRDSIVMNNIGGRNENNGHSNNSCSDSSSWDGCDDGK